jgi:hypothetical protein
MGCQEGESLPCPARRIATFPRRTRAWQVGADPSCIRSFETHRVSFIAVQGQPALAEDPVDSGANRESGPVVGGRRRSDT